MHVAISTFRLTEGASESELLAASDAVHDHFEAAQPGMLTRILIRNPDGSYADIDVFADEASMGQVMAAAQGDAFCGEYFGMMELIGEPAICEAVRIYE